MTDTKGLYWTAFTFRAEPDPNRLHVTHKYLGELSEVSASAALKRVSAYWKVYPLKTFFARFSVEDYFLEGTLRVIKEETPDASAFQGFWKLRKELDDFRVDDYAFNPHVTTALPRVHAYIDSYVFMRDLEIIKRWQAV